MLELKKISKAFGGKELFKNLELTIKDGTILTIVGPSGGGKTTLLRMLAGLEAADGGAFYLDGQIFDPVDTANQEQVVGVVFQDFQLFPHLTVAENIGLAPKLVLKESPEEIATNQEKFAEKLGLQELLDHYPFQLSGGQKQRVAIARAMAMRPKVLAYDEPTSALDPALRQQVEQLILSLKKEGMTQIVVTHDRQFAENIADNLFEVKKVK